MDEQVYKLSDEALVKQVQNGETELFAEIIRRYEAKMLRYAYRFLLKNDAEDEVQEVFLKAYQNIQSFNPDLKFSSWLYRIAHNQFVNLIRKQSRSPLSFFDFDTLFPHPVAPQRTEREVEIKQIRQQLKSCLDRLDVKYREVLVLSYLEELSYKEISDVLKIPVATVGVRIARGKQALKKVYKQYFEDEIYGK